jgi:hypothetical protein
MRGGRRPTGAPVEGRRFGLEESALHRRRRRARIAAAALACALLIGIAAAPAGADSRGAALAGVAIHPWRLGPDTTPLPFWPLRDPSTREQIFGAIQAMGVHQARVDLRWERVEPLVKGVRDWSEFDGIHDSAVAHGITLLPMVAMPPPWANGNRGPWSFPDNPRDFEDFLTAALKRYPDIPAWEIWNEPNVPSFSQPTVDPQKFVELLQAAHNAKERAGSSAQIISGGLLWSGGATMAFFEQMVALHAFDYVDGFGIHPYSTQPPDVAGSGFLELPAFHDRLEQIGHSNVGVWVTEYGAPNSTQGSQYSSALGLDAQADRLRDAFSLAARWPWVKNLTWYEFQDLCVDPADFTCNFGLVRQDLSPKPAAGAMKTIVAGDVPKIRSATTLVRVRPPGGRYRPGGRRYVSVGGRTETLAGDPVEGPVTVTLSWSAKRHARALGTRTARVDAVDGRFQTTLRNPRPGYWRAVARYAGTPDYETSASDPVTFVVRPLSRR